MYATESRLSENLCRLFFRPQMALDRTAVQDIHQSFNDDLAMAPKDYRALRPSRRWKFLQTLTSCFLTLLVATSGSKTIDEVKRRHRVNAELLAGGQLTLELFPPLSYLFAVVVPNEALRSTIVAARLTSTYMVLYHTANLHVGGWWRIEPTASCAVLFLQVWQRLVNMCTDEANPLEASAAVAACLLLLPLLNFRGKGGARVGWARQILVIFAGMLGCNAADWILGYLAVTAQDLYSISSTKISSNGPQLARKLALAVLRTVCLPLLLLVAVYGLLSPFSETSAGFAGINHNLHFLDASTRRSLSPQEPVSLEALDLARYARHIPEYALIPFLPLSLYVPNAGFLWGSLNDGTVSSSVEETGNLPMEACFSDPIGRRYPWAFEQTDAPGDEHLDGEQRSFVQSHLSLMALVYLRSRIDHMYLGTAASLDVADQDGRADEQEPFHRFPIGFHAEKSVATVWVLDYDPTRDDGFRLYNPHRDCHLATTFRSTGLSQDGASHDDSVYAEMKGALEASCTRLVSKSASTFWAIEGRLEHPRSIDSDSWQKRFPRTVRPLIEIFQKGYTILRGHVSLYRWQSYYSEGLELLLSPLAFSRVQERWGAWVERLMLLLFLGYHSFFLLVKQRTGRRLPGGGRSVFPALFCWIHVLVYTVLGAARPHGDDVQLMLALYGLRVMLRQ
ncbi:uncharacterized protein F4812DRAFT_105429 [Daldinia caldariorum]|uniref:uncharacterized protein n=1 Tax=Daldinia caldariorum TaxID=326644 RepID=UPI0020088707|nr:uncharacterized protein F4812DRAFT_105429 [Daldinia caldariorum]KAI1465658.1 hypothetical protein F4812DRAFT_105429 [Daldinia caldariorum]